jgi:sulfoxide reductase heme-binding subunit YedZ
MKKSWKKLHELTYLAMFLLIWHVIDKMWGHWSDITLLAMLGITGITLLFILRKFMERRNKLARTKGAN